MTGDSPSEASPFRLSLSPVRGGPGACSAQPAGFLPGSSYAALFPPSAQWAASLADSLHPRDRAPLLGHAGAFWSEPLPAANSGIKELGGV